MVTKLHEKNISRLFYIFLIIHIIAWTIAPFLVRFNLPLDAIEGSTWGHQLEWGYDKNPFMNAWLTSIAIKLSGNSSWLIYLFSQFSVAIGFFATFQLAKKIVSVAYALVAVFALEGIQYFNLHAIDFNDNTLEIGFWSLTILFFYKALLKPNYINWILTCILAGCCMMTKYYAVMLFIPMGLFMLIFPENRIHFKKGYFYAGAIIFTLIILPHFFWLFSHDFVTINYAINRVSSPPTAWNHLFFPAQFAWQQFETFLPVMILFILFFNTSSRQQTQYNNETFNKRFLLFIGLGPFILTIVTSAIFGIKLRAAWGQPLLSLWPLILLTWFHPLLTIKRFYYFSATMMAVLIVLVTGYCIALIRADSPSSANYPGKNIALLLTNEWHKTYHTPLPFVAGSRWLAGNIGFYSSDKPAIYIDWDKRFSPWIDEKKLTQTGALFVWTTEKDDLPFEIIKTRFPRLGPLKTLQFSWLRNPNMAPITIKVAFLPPQNSKV